MADTPTSPPTAPPPAAPRPVDPREARLAAALRANLRRRKVAARPSRDEAD